MGVRYTSHIMDFLMGSMPSGNAPVVRKPFETRHPRISFAMNGRGRYYPNIASVYMSLINDEGNIGHSKLSGALDIGDMCKTTYYNHVEEIYNRMQDHYDDRQDVVIKKIRLG